MALRRIGLAEGSPPWQPAEAWRAAGDRQGDTEGYNGAGTMPGAAGRRTDATGAPMVDGRMSRRYAASAAQVASPVRMCTRNPIVAGHSALTGNQGLASWFLV